MTADFIAFAAHQFAINARQDDGETLKEHLMAYERATGKQHQMLADAPVLPRGLAPLWGDFMDLHACRGVGMGGPLRITFADIDAWSRVSWTTLEAWELAAIRGADDAYLASIAKGNK